ncbi:CDC15 [Candida margitis]|uniref:CDC15 n=1 Tax=Candida margitis TaxID=1775924 RepID=UPI002226DD9C|nr:CDC15 [Candida margitis]KAI5961505.1 CDC15 [Candida margitis]
MQRSTNQFSNLENIGNLDIQLSSHSISSKQAKSKKATLSKYQENVSEAEELEGFEFYDDLSFSKFSNSNALSKSLPILVRESQGDESPFMRKLQEKSASSSKFVDYANDLRHSSGSAHHSPTFDANSRESRFHESHRLEEIPEGTLNHFNGQNRSPAKSFGDIKSTPRHKRTTSVKISLTPAQKTQPKSNVHTSTALNNFEFGTLIGNGAFASVYKAKNLATGHLVAIKQIRLEQNQDVGVLMGEIDLLKILKHSNIVKYHGFVKTSTSLNVILEYCGGGSLRQLYKKRKSGLPEVEIVKYVREVLAGLNYLHEQGVVHRDVKAANVLLTDKGEVKLADFGVASKVSSQHFTVVGTPNWMAPETVLGGEGLCTASDIWSLGATIIELFTTNPPYHELNAMATLHAIGTDDHPPMPKTLSTLASDFLMECFQKQPNLRVSASLLLKHKWLNQGTSGDLIGKNDSKRSSSYVLPPLDEPLGEPVSNEEPKYYVDDDGSEMQSKFFRSSLISKTKLSKNDLLNKFQENDDPEVLSSVFIKTGPFAIFNRDSEDTEENDPFLDIEVDNFDTNEIEIQTKMEYLVTKLSQKLEQLHAGNADAAEKLIKVTGRMCHLIKKYPFSHDTFIRDHGVLSLMELLESHQDIPKQNQLWYYTLSVLNYVFEANIGQLENFCFLGGIPTIAHFRNSTYDKRVRLEVARFINCLNRSNNALSMFVSCGGLRLVAKFVEEDFDTTPTFPMVAIDTIHNVLTRDVSRSKSNICRILSKHGVLFWFVVLLNMLLKRCSQADHSLVHEMQLAAGKVVDILRFFSQAETKVRAAVANVDIFKLLVKLYDKLEFAQQIVVLKFFRSMSCIGDVLKYLYKADILEFLAGLLEKYVPSRSNYKEVINNIAPLVYNCLSLNYAKVIEFINLGALPHLKVLSMVKLPFRQFILPIMCELVYCGKSIRSNLRTLDIPSLYFNLLLDPYWQSNALESIYAWYQMSPKHIKVDGPRANSCLAAGFLLPKVASLESVLDDYLKLLAMDVTLVKTMSEVNIVENILTKLKSHSQNPVIQVSLLKILKIVMINVVISGFNCHIQENEEKVMKSVIDSLQNLPLRQTSLLVGEISTEIMNLVFAR